EDVFARTGGGEFAVVVPETDKAGATDLASRLLKIIGETAFGFDDVQIPVTISVGVAGLSEVNLEEGETAVGGRVSVGTSGSTVPDPFFTSASGTSNDFNDNSRTGEA